MNALATLIKRSLASGLKKQAMVECSVWTQEYRMIGKPKATNWSFKYYPWLKEIHDCKSELWVAQKGAQLGFTETLLNLVLFKIDVQRTDCLYVLPSKTPDAADFSAARFNEALEASPYLSNLFSDVKNVGHKRAGNTNLYIRGSKSRAGLKSIPVGYIVIDELEEMAQENIPLAMERVAGQANWQAAMISTPRIDNSGINKEYQKTTQEHFFFTCPHCSRLTELIFPDCIVITGDDPYCEELEQTHLICKECKHPLDNDSKHIWLSDGQWVPEYPNRVSRGFHVSQLYSTAYASRPSAIAKLYLESLRDPSAEQEFFNSKLGMPHIVEGAKISEKDIEACTKNHKIQPNAPTNRLTTIGIDVGKFLHCEICEWQVTDTIIGQDSNVRAECKVISIIKLLHFEELDHLMNAFRPRMAIIDANPERRKAYEFSQRWYGHVKLCFYGRGIQGKQIAVGRDEQGKLTDEPTIIVDRTSWLDLSLGRFRNRTIIIPMDTPTEYKNQIMAPVRIYMKDPDGNPIGRYDAGSQADHYAHARNYAEIALPFGLAMVSNQDINVSL